jgi:phosphoribosylformimino-5-aminoimidazole carboxamide ribotide isomerase
MLVIPAIDLYAGRCVRLFQGDYARETRYADDPVGRARYFADCGAQWLHVVDLDAAEGKGADNRSVIARIRASAACRIQCGGGVRSLRDARELFALGINKVIVGTAIVRFPDEVARWISELGGSFVGGIDAWDGRVKVSGWAQDAEIRDTETSARLKGLGFQGMVYTNISRDSTMAGPDIGRTILAAESAGLPTIVSGGIGDQEHMQAVFECGEPLISGVIIGKALYEGRIDLRDAVTRFRRNPESSW